MVLEAAGAYAKFGLGRDDLTRANPCWGNKACEGLVEKARRVTDEPQSDAF